MKFSVIIPAYNCAGTLRETVGSIRASGLTDYELLLIDDGSTDGTAGLCDALCRQYPELRCIHQANAGVSAARNRGIQTALGEYIWFVDSDDTVDPGALTQAVQIIQAQKPDMLIFGMTFDYYHRGKCYRRDKLTPPASGMLSLPELLQQFRLFYDCNSLTPVWNKFYARRMLLDSGVLFHRDMILMEDFLFVLEVLPFCRTIYSLPEPIYRYRQAEDEQSAYRRLQRIPALDAYLIPFEQGINALQVPDGEALIAGLYRMLFRQKLYYASPRAIRQGIAAHQAGRYRGLPMENRPLKIFLQNKKTQLRHRLAVAVKSNPVYQRIRHR